MWALLGGSGFEKFEEFKKLEALPTATPFGETSSGFSKIQLGTTQMLFIPRHGENHEKTPSEVNYRANIWALKKYGEPIRMFIENRLGLIAAAAAAALIGLYFILKYFSASGMGTTC